MPAKSKGFACPDSLWPDMSTCVEAVASGKGYLPCISLTKYLRKGIMNNSPKKPPNALDRKTFMKSTEISGYLACRIYNAGKVKMEPATIIPEQAPMLCMITFSPKEFFRWVAPATPTAMIVIGIAASNTCPTFNPK